MWGDKRRVENYNTQVRRARRGAGLNYHLSKAVREGFKEETFETRSEGGQAVSGYLDSAHSRQGYCVLRVLRQELEEVSVAGVDGVE